MQVRLPLIVSAAVLALALVASSYGPRLAAQSSSTELIANGGFEANNTLDRYFEVDSWTIDRSLDGGGFSVEEGACWSANNSTGLTYSGDYAFALRCATDCATDDVGILTSDAFVAGQALSFLGLTEINELITLSEPVDFEVRILDPAGNVLTGQAVTTNLVTLDSGAPGFDDCATGAAVDGSFSLHTIDTSAYAGHGIRVQFRQSTNIAGSGLVTLIDDVSIIDPPPNVTIDGCDTGVPDKVLETGETITELIAQCAADASTHGDFESCVADLKNALMKDDVISANQKGDIQSCAAVADIP